MLGALVDMLLVTLELLFDRLLVTLGVLTIVGSVFGYAGARFHPVLLTIYLVVGTCATTLQLVLVLAIFGAQNKVADAIAHFDTKEGKLGILRQVPF
jgi:hypothetical protein